MESPHPSHRWVEAQRATPSFATAHGTAPNILDQPLPAKLGGGGVAGAASPSPIINAASPSSSARQPPRSTTPGRPIHEDLLDRGKLYEQRRETLREKAIRNELKKCRDVPKISAMGHNIERNEKIVTRLYKVQREKDKMAEYKRMEIDAADDKIVAGFFKPRISRRGGRAAGKTMAKQHDMWDFKRQEKLEELRREKIMRELENTYEAPEIDPHSAQLAARRREKEGMAGYSHFEAMLERDRLSKLARWEASQIHHAQTCPMSPQITQLAASLEQRRHGEDVAERLYREGQELQRRRTERARRHAEDEQTRRRSASANAGSSSGSRLDRFLTKATPFNNDEDSNGPMDVAERSMRFVQEREERIRQTQEMERRMHTPSINPVSDAIASKMRQSTMERLTTTPLRQPRSTSGTPSSSTRRTHQQQQEEGVDSGAFASPSSAASQQQQPHYTKNDLYAYERLIREEEKRQARLQQAKKLQEEREVAECSFRPQLSTSPYTAAATGAAATASVFPDNNNSNNTPPHAAAAEATNTNIYERNQAWLRRKEHRLEQQRQDQLQADEELPYSPYINPASAQMAAQIPLHDGETTAARAANPEHRDDDASTQQQPSTQNVSGFAEFLRRHAEARQLSEEKQAAATRHTVCATIPASGMTTPRGFRLHTDRNRSSDGAAAGTAAAASSPFSIRSLQPPAAPPRHVAAQAAGGGGGGGNAASDVSYVQREAAAALSADEVRAMAEQLIVGSHQRDRPQAQGEQQQQQQSGASSRYWQPDPQDYGFDDADDEGEEGGIHATQGGGGGVADHFAPI